METDFTTYFMTFLVVAGLVLLILIMLRMEHFIKAAVSDEKGRKVKRGLSSFFDKGSEFHDEKFQKADTMLMGLLFITMAMPMFWIVLMWLGFVAQQDYITFLVEEALPNVLGVMITIFMIKGIMRTADSLAEAVE